MSLTQLFDASLHGRETCTGLEYVDPDTGLASLTFGRRPHEHPHERRRCCPHRVHVRHHGVAKGTVLTHAISSDRTTLTTDSIRGRVPALSRGGEGSMAEMWKAHYANLDREVAIQMLLRGALDDATTRGRLRRRFLHCHEGREGPLSHRQLLAQREDSTG